MNIAVIGTNVITRRLLEAAALHPDFHLAAVCGSSKEKAAAFAADYGECIPAYGDYKELASLAGLDGVYIASPNSLHHPMTLFFLEAGIPVLCEKPLAVNLRQIVQVTELAARKNVLLMEGIMPLFTPNFQAIRDALPQLGTVRKASLTFCQYSSRYDSYRAGVVQNAFKREMMGGSLLDIGIYPLYHALALFGKPDRVAASAQLLETGVDGSGVVTLSYPGKDVVVLHSKITFTTLPSEIQGEDGSLTYTGGSNPLTVLLHRREGAPLELARPQHSQRMYYELTEFIRCILGGEKQSPYAPHALALEVYAVADEIRRQTGVRFDCDL